MAVIPAQLMQSLEALHQLEPNRFLAMVRKAATAAEWYDAVLALRYAANSKELRDTGDERVHGLCEDILQQVRHINDYFRMKLVPASPRQRRDWDLALAGDPFEQRAFQRDGSIELSLLDADRAGSTLRVRRVWNHVCNFGGSWTTFAIGLDADQFADWQARRARLRTLEQAIENR